MLSNKTIHAIQVLFLLKGADKRGLTVAELKHKARLNTMGINRVVRQLMAHGWITTDNRARHSLAPYAAARTLFDLILVMHGEIVLGTHIVYDNIPFWGATAQECIPHAEEINKRLGNQVGEMLKEITVMELITETAYKSTDVAEPQKRNI